MFHINGADVIQKAYSASYRMDYALNKHLTILFRTKHGKALTVTPNEVPVLVPQEDSKARRAAVEEKGASFLVRADLRRQESAFFIGKPMIPWVKQTLKNPKSCALSKASRHQRKGNDEAEEKGLFFLFRFNF